MVAQLETAMIVLLVILITFIMLIGVIEGAVYSYKTKKAWQKFYKKPAPRMFTRVDKEIWVIWLPGIRQSVANLQTRDILLATDYGLEWAGDGQDFNLPQTLDNDCKTEKDIKIDEAIIRALRRWPRVRAYSGEGLDDFQVFLQNKRFSEVSLNEFKRTVEDWYMYLDERRNRRGKRKLATKGLL